MTIIVVDEAEGVVVVFGGKAEGVVGGEGVVCDGRGRDGTGDSTEGGVVVVCCDAIARLKVNTLRNILIAIAGIEEFITCATLSKKRTRGDGFRRVPCGMSPRKLFL